MAASALLCLPRTNLDHVKLYLRIGSEPSLTSRTGQTKSASSVNASKNTLYSENTSTSSTKQSSNSQSEATANTLVTSRVFSLEQKSQDDVDSFKVLDTSGSPKAPSYLKLSCSVSGYNKYNSYNNFPANKNDNKSETNCNNNDDCRIQRVVRHSTERDDAEKHVILNGYCAGQNGIRTSNDLESHDLNVNPKCQLVNGAVHDDESLRDTTLHNEGIINDSLTKSQLNSDSSSIKIVHTNGQANGLSHHGTSHVELVAPPSEAAKPDILTPNKDGAYFLIVVEGEETKIKSLCAVWETDLTTNIPEEAGGKLRAVIGKANLLTSKKFKQFRGLCDQNMSQAATEPFHTTNQDLAGFWDMVLLQIEEIHSMFGDIKKLKLNNWNSPVKEKPTLPATSSRSVTHRITPVKAKASSKESNTPKSKDSAKAREQARQRLLAAKRAGRQRKASQSDDVEIYVS